MVDCLVAAGADVNARCVDHGSTAAQYQIRNHEVVYRLLEHGSEFDVFMAAVLDDVPLFRQCLAIDPNCCNSRLGRFPWTSHAKGNIYQWKIGHDYTPQQAAREHGHKAVLKLLIEHASETTRFMDAIWIADRREVDRMLAENKNLLKELNRENLEALARAAWWYNPDAVELMLESGFDPHLTGVHNSTPLDRAAFHGYADIIQLLLTHDPDPPVHFKNEFGGTPLSACIYGLRHGWVTGNPQDHVKSVRLLLEAGSPVEDDLLGTGNEEIDAMLSSRR